MADVKFSELTTLAAADVATDDIFAVVDTSATTSKKLTVANLMGQVPSGAPLHINDTTDSSSSTTGAISTDGGLGVTLKSTLTGLVTVGTGIVPDASDGAYLGTTALQFSDLFLADGAVINLGDDQDVTLTHVADTGVLLNTSMALQFRDSALSISSSTDGQLDIDADTEVEITTTTVDLNGALDVSGLSTLGGNLTLSATNPVISIGASPNAVTLTHSSDGLTLDTDSKLFFRDSAISVGSSTDGQMEIAADTEVQIDTGTVDINGAVDISTDLTVGDDVSLASDDAVLNFGADSDVNLTHVPDAALMLNSNMALRFRDAALGINSSADGQLDIYADETVEVTLAGTTPTFAVAASTAYDTIFKHVTDGYDMVFQQGDGSQVAVVTDGAKAVPSGFATVQTAKGGFGHKRIVISHTQADTSTSTLTTGLSGALIQLIGDGTGTGYADLITLPAITAADVGVFFDFVVVSTAFDSGDTLKILTETAAAGGTQGFVLDAHNAADDSFTRTAFSAGATDFLTLPASTPIGTTVRCEAVLGGTGTMWMATSHTTGVTISASSS